MTTTPTTTRTIMWLLTLLPKQKGAVVLLVGDEQGVLTHWSAIRDARGFRMQPIREFALGSPGVSILAEARRKGFVTVDAAPPR